MCASAAIGVPVPLCSCSVVPVVAEMRKKGASTVILHVVSLSRHPRPVRILSSWTHAFFGFARGGGETSSQLRDGSCCWHIPVLGSSEMAALRMSYISTTNTSIVISRATTFMTPTTTGIASTTTNHGEHEYLYPGQKRLLCQSNTTQGACWASVAG